MKSFSAEHWRRARTAWLEGEFSEEWIPFRDAAREAGILYPPEGTNLDSFEADFPSQRAILIREIRDRPKALLAIIRRSRSWNDVVAACMTGLAQLREDVGLDEAPNLGVTRSAKRADAEALGSILDRLAQR